MDGISAESLAISARAIRARLRAGLTVGAVVRSLAWPTARLPKVEDGSRRLFLDEWCVLARLYGVPVADLDPGLASSLDEPDEFQTVHFGTRRTISITTFIKMNGITVEQGEAQPAAGSAQPKQAVDLRRGDSRLGLSRFCVQEDWDARDALQLVARRAIAAEQRLTLRAWEVSRPVDPDAPSPAEMHREGISLRRALKRFLGPDAYRTLVDEVTA